MDNEVPLIIELNDEKYMFVTNSNVENIGEVSLFLSFNIIKDIESDEFEEYDLEHYKNNYIFCKKKDDKFEKIEDTKEIENLRTIFDLEEQKIFPDELAIELIKFIQSGSSILLKPIAVAAMVGLLNGNQILGAKKIDEEERKKFIEEQQDNIKRMKEEMGLDVDVERAYKRLEKLKIRIITSDRALKKLKHTKTRAFYNPDNKTEYFAENDIKSKSVNAKKVRLHETIHYMSGSKLGFFSKLVEGKLIEGETESLVTRVYNNNTSCTFINGVSILTGNQIYSQYNFPIDTSYKEYVSLTRQIEYITGADSALDVMNRTKKFY